MREVLKLIVVTLLFHACVNKDEAVKIEGNIVASLSASQSTIDFGEKPISFKYYQTLTITNTGGNFSASNIKASAFAAESAYSYRGGNWPGLNGTCGTSLASGKSCKIEIEFSPESEQYWNDSFSISYSNGIESASLSIRLIGYAGNVAKIEATPEAVSYSVLEPNSYREATITLKNVGGLAAQDLFASLDLISAFNFKGGFYPGLGGTCGASLGRQRSCTVIVQYYPLSIGSFDANVEVIYSNPLNPVVLQVPVSGIAASIEGNIRFLGGTMLAFIETPQGGSSVKKMKISNAGYLNAEQISIATTGQFSLVSTDCNSTLPVAENCELTLNFSPTVVGDVTGTVDVSYHSGKSIRTTTLTTTGTGLQPGLITFSTANPYDFGEYGVLDSTSYTFGLINTGELPVTNIAIGLPSAPYSITANSCSGTLSPLASCVITVRFNPTAEGLISGAVTVNYENGVASSSAVLSFTGTGLSIAVLKLSAPSYSFGVAPINTVLEKEVILSNIGIIEATSILLPNMVNPFSFAGGSFPGTGGTCGSTLAPGNSCSLKLSATSAVGNVFSANLILDYFNGLAPSFVRISTYATFKVPAKISISPAPSFNFGKKSLGNSKNAHMTLLNTGEYTAIFDSPLAFQLGNQAMTLSLSDNPWDRIWPDCTGFTSLGPGEGCHFQTIFTPTAIANYSDTITLSYHDPNSSGTLSYIVTGEGADMADLVQENNLGNYLLTAKGGYQDITYNIRNRGTLTATSLQPPTVTENPANPALGVFSSSSNCSSTLAPGASCTVTVRFSPTANGSYLFNPRWDYNDGFGMTFDTFNLEMTAVDPANLKVSPVGITDWGLVVVNTSVTKTFTIINNGGVSATNLSINNLAAPFSLITNNCGTTVTTSGCSFTIAFTPTNIGILQTLISNLSYFNGAANAVSANFTLKGTGEPPLSLHKGWSKITAWGSKVTSTNVSSSDAQLSFSWNNMTPLGGSISGYNVYRKLASDPAFDFDSPVAVDISTTNRSFTDTLVSPGTVYQYIVRPINSGFPSRTLENFSTLRIIVPPNNMALVHRWSANSDMCNKLGLPINLNLEHGCYFNGLGKTSDGKLDIGYDLLVDRFETGADGTPRYGQLPLSNASQVTAWNTCTAQTGIGLAGASGSYTKRLLKRREFILASQWSSSLSASQITAYEAGTTGSGECNGDGSGVEPTGYNSNCISKYGISDTAGNSWEWVSDRTFDGKGVTDDNMRLDPNNRDLDGINFTSHTNAYLDTYECFSPVLGIPLFSSGSGCGDELSVSSFGASNFHDDYFFAPGASGLKVALVGGGFSTNQYSGSLTLGFLSASIRGAPRCGFSVP